jgi:hypothetical protein
MASRAAAVLNRVIRLKQHLDLSTSELLRRSPFLQPCSRPSSANFWLRQATQLKIPEPIRSPGDTYRQRPPAPEAPP